MKKIVNAELMKMALAFLIFLFLVSSCKKQDTPDTLDKDTSYAFGMLMANQINGQMGLTGLHFDYQAFMEGFRDFNELKETRLTQDQAIEKISHAVTRINSRSSEKTWIEGEKNREEAEKNRDEGEVYMMENRARNGVITTSSGLQYEVINEGKGRKPGPDDSVLVHYEGSLLNGEVFDSSFSRGVPAELSLNYVIPGWKEGVPLMNEGSTYRFVVPSDLAYGPERNGPIPPGATLIFKVELISIIEKENK
jgi:FKBP-type peptidyl-prolyl cis-trans isomerase